METDKKTLVAASIILITIAIAIVVVYLMRSSFEEEQTVSFQNLKVSDYRVNPNQTLTFTGSLCSRGYAVHDGTIVQIRLAEIDYTGRDLYGAMTLNGKFVVNLPAETNVGKYTYIAYAIVWVGDKPLTVVSGGFPAVIVDKITITLPTEEEGASP